MASSLLHYVWYLRSYTFSGRKYYRIERACFKSRQGFRCKGNRGECGHGNW